MKKIKRRKDHPVLFAKKTKAKAAPRGAWYEGFRARCEAILARTRAARAEIDATIAGADMRKLDALPVIVYPTGRAPRSPGMHRLRAERQRDRDERYDPAIDAPPARAPIAPPVEVREVMASDTAMVLCECGCGSEVISTGRRGHPRRFINGHNRFKTKATAALARAA